MNKQNIRPEKFDAIIIGSGQGGNPLAKDMAASGWKTAVVERYYPGGSCINYGCTPSKTMAASAKTAEFVKRASEFGIHISSFKVNMKEVYERKRKTVESFRKGTLKRLTSSENITLIKGEASFINQKTVKVISKNKKTRFLTSEKIFINTGGRPSIPEIEGIEQIEYLDSTSVMELQVLPAHLIILGGGYIGVEFGQMFRRFGSEVTIIQRNKQLLTREDPDIADEVKKILVKDGLKIYSNAKIKNVKKQRNKIVISFTLKDKEKTITGSHLLIAAGHKPNTQELNLSATGIETDRNGYVKINDKLETKVEGIYALGDVKGGPAFTHISYDDYRIIRDNILFNKNRSTKDRFVPYTVFIDPQLGRIGLNETEAKQKGIDYLVAKMPMSSIARAIEVSETRGSMKIIIEKNSGKILGGTILGIEGGELMAMIQIAMMGNLKYTQLQDAVFTHPTLAESLNIVFSSKNLQS